MKTHFPNTLYFSGIATTMFADELLKIHTSPDVSDRIAILETFKAFCSIMIADAIISTVRQSKEENFGGIKE
mgnify:CR=1 FL=1